MKKFIAKISLVALVLMTFGMVSPAHAAPDSITDITLTNYWFVSTPDSQPVVATLVMDVTGGTYSTGDSISVSTNTTFPNGLECDPSGIQDIDQDGNDDSCDDTGTNVVWTFANDGLGGSVATVDIPLKVPGQESGPGIFYMEFEIRPDASGAVAFGVSSATTDDQDNVVQVTSSVSPTVTLNISDTNNLNKLSTCDLGIINEASVSECSYNVHVGTNMTNVQSPVIQIRALADGPMTDGTNSLQPAAGTACAAGNGECYGMVVAGSSGWGGTEQNNFDTNHQTVPEGSPATTIASQNVPIGSLDGGLHSIDYITVTHAAVAGPVTVPSSYSQDVTWTAVVYY